MTAFFKPVCEGPQSGTQLVFLPKTIMKGTENQIKEVLNSLHLGEKTSIDSVLGLRI